MSAVILNHLTGWPSGAFVGVDVFFVISGFLITGLLLKERRSTGRISLVDFYKRRFRRIIPATIPVVVFTVIASYLLLNTAQGKQTLVDSVWSLLFAANWRMASTGTDYFQVGGPTSPLEHFWSLAVEEQFYLVWPVLIVIIFAVVNRRVGYASKVGHRLVGSVMAAVIVVSFTYAGLQAIGHPTTAYFSTFTRVWELGVGALLAAMSASFVQVPDRWRTVLGWLGLVGIVASMFLIGPDTPFPAPLGALPVLSTAVVIAAGTGGQPRFLRPLTNPFSVWVGELSYSLYLWHFPIIVIMAAMAEKGSSFYNIACLFLILAFSIAAFYVIEDPVRRSSWLRTDRSPGTSPHAGVHRPPRANASPRLKRASVVFLAFSCVVVLTISVTRQQPAMSDSVSGVRTQTKSPQSPEAPKRESTPAQSERMRDIVTALSASEWPTLNPRLGDIRKSVGSPPCALGYESPPIVSASEIKRACVQGDPNADHTILLVGDSLANSYLPAVVEAVQPRGWNVVSLTRGGCPALKIKVVQDNSRLKYPKCDQQQELTRERIKELKPDLILMTSSPRAVNSLLGSGALGQEALQEWSQALKESLVQFAETAPVVVVQPPPRGSDLGRCATRFSKPTDCASSVAPIHAAVSKVEKKVVKTLDMSRVQYVSTQDWFCSEDLRCPAFVGETPTFADGAHLTVPAARLLGPLMFDGIGEAMQD